MPELPMKFDSEARIAAVKYGLSPAMVIGLCMVESGGDSYAWNPEQRYRHFWDVSKDRPFRALTESEIASEFSPVGFRCLKGDPDQEWWAQQASWGLMQVMGAVARERGFRGPYLTELCDPVVNLEIGCKHLKMLLDWAKGNIEPALAAYNGGKLGNLAGGPLRNQLYATKVVNAMSRVS